MSTQSASKQSRDSINVQQYRTQQFKQPQQLQQPSQQSIVQQFIPTTTHPLSKPTISSSKRSSLQQQQQESIRNQLILQFKISQLQKICSTLTSANEKLLDKIQQLQQQNDRFKSRIIKLQTQNQQHKQQSRYQQSKSDSDDNQFVQSLNDSKQSQNQRKFSSQIIIDDSQQLKLQQEVVDIQQMIKQYRQELNKAQQINKNIKQTYNSNISTLQQQLNQSKNKLIQTQAINKQLQQQLLDLQQKNQALQTQIQSIINSNTQQTQYYQDITSRNRTQSRSSQYQTPMNQRHAYNNIRANNNNRQYYQQDYSQPMNPFDSSVQVELQKLIQKLVKQLQYQRSIKKKMTDQMKRIQKDMLQSEKQIMIKNKKIYQLQMNLLKGQKNYLFNTTNTNSVLTNSQINDIRKDDKPKYSMLSPSRDQNNKRSFGSPHIKDLSPKVKQKYLQGQKQRINTSATYSPSQRQSPTMQPNYKQRQYQISRNPNISQSPSSSQGKLLQTFSLLQLLNEPTITLTIKQKLHICLKIVAFYEQKIYQYKNYNLLMLENVLVTNFNRINLRLIKIRVEENKKGSENETNHRVRKNSKDEIADGPQKVIWNLGFLLNSLLIDVPSKQQNLGQSQQQKKILELIDNILDNRNLTRQVFVQFKTQMQSALQKRVK